MFPCIRFSKKVDKLHVFMISRGLQLLTAEGVAADVVVELLPQYISALAIHVAIDDDVVGAALHFHLHERKGDRCILTG